MKQKVANSEMDTSCLLFEIARCFGKYWSVTPVGNTLDEDANDIDNNDLGICTCCLLC